MLTEWIIEQINLVVTVGNRGSVKFDFKDSNMSTLWGGKGVLDMSDDDV